MGVTEQKARFASGHDGRAPLLHNAIATAEPPVPESDLAPPAPVIERPYSWFAEHSERTQLLPLGFRLEMGARICRER